MYLKAPKKVIGSYGWAGAYGRAVRAVAATLVIGLMLLVG